MKILIENSWHRVSNFIDYLIEHFTEIGEHTKLKLKAEDVYDKKLINKRIQSLQGKLLLGYEDGFEILGTGLLEDIQSFKEEIVNLIEEPEVIEKITDNKIKQKLVNFELEFVQDDEIKFAKLNFTYLNLMDL